MRRIDFHVLKKCLGIPDVLRHLAFAVLDAERARDCANKHVGRRYSSYQYSHKALNASIGRFSASAQLQPVAATILAIRRLAAGLLRFFPVSPSQTTSTVAAS